MGGEPSGFRSTIVDSRCWLLIDPDVWIWPSRARNNAAGFLDERRGERYNNVYNGLVNAWLPISFGEIASETRSKVCAVEVGTMAEAPSFTSGRAQAIREDWRHERPRQWTIWL